MKIAHPLALLGAVALSLLAYTAPAAAQATRTWVSGVGDDANPCSRTAPCKTFAGAISKTAAGGEISVLDPGGFGAVTINKSISIVSEGFEAGVLASGTNGIVISAGAGDIINLRGLTIDGAGTGLVGIKFNSGAVLNVQKCTIKNFRGSPGFGIQMLPTTPMKFSIEDTVISNNGLAASGGGFLVRPFAGATTAVGELTRVAVVDNTFGIDVDGTGGGGTGAVSLLDSAVVNSAQGGVLANSNAANALIFMDSSAANNNGTTGVAASGGAPAQVFISNSLVQGNATGLGPSGGGQIISWKNNMVNSNTTSNGAPTSSLTPI